MLKLFATLIKALLICAMGGGALSVSAKEPVNWIFGFGIGAGLRAKSTKNIPIQRVISLD